MTNSLTAAELRVTDSTRIEGEHDRRVIGDATFIATVPVGSQESQPITYRDFGAAIDREQKAFMM